MEVFAIICAILFLFAAVAATYFIADSRNKNQRIKQLSELIAVEQSNLREWQNKALFKNGNTPLGFETREKVKSETVPQARIVTRGELEARERSSPEHITTVGNVNGSRIKRQSVVEKAGEIINATK